MKTYKNHRSIYNLTIGIPIILFIVVVKGDFSDEKVLWMLGIFSVFILAYLFDKFFVSIYLSGSYVVSSWKFWETKISIEELYSFQRYKTLLTPYLSLIDKNGKVVLRNISSYFKSSSEAEEFYAYLKSKNPNIKTNIDFTKPLDIPWPPKEYFSEPK